MPAPPCLQRPTAQRSQTMSRRLGMLCALPWPGQEGMEHNPGGLIVHRGSRTERLADALALQLEAQRPANPLAKQMVVVAHPGLQRWLLGQRDRKSVV